MAINSTLANQIFFASQGVPATGKENSAGQAYTDAIAYAHAATYNPLEVLGGDTKEFVVKIYKTVLGRTNPLQDDPEGVVYWTNAINNGLNKAAFIDEMTAVAIKNGGSDKAAAEAANAAYVNEIYSNILGRPASQDPAGSQYWIDALNKGTIARSKVVDEINAAAAVNKDAGFQTKNTEYVTGLYKDLLGREPEAEGLKYWTDALNAGTSRAELVVSLINSANSGTGADKANLAAKTEALNSFSANFTDYNILPGEGEYNNIRGEAGTKINGVNASTQDPAGEVTNFLNNGYKDQHQEGQPTPAGTTVYATWNGALRAEWADATNTSDAEVTFKADTEEEKGLIRQAEKLGVDVSANTKNVKFKNLNGATEALKEVHINSNPASQATVNVDALAQLPAADLTLIDRDGSTTIAWNSKVSNLKTINLGNGDDNLIISNANNIADVYTDANGKAIGLAIIGGAGNDTLTLGTGNFAGKFTSISGIEKIVTASQEAPSLNLSALAASGAASGDKLKADTLDVSNTLKLIIDNATGQGGVSGTSVDISKITGTGKVILDATTALTNAASTDTTSVIGSTALANDVLALKDETTYDKIATIKDIDLVAANKVTLSKAAALKDGFTLAGDVDGLTSGSLTLSVGASGDLITNNKIDASKVKGVANSALNIEFTGDASGAVTDIIGSTDANLTETVKLGSATYSALKSIKDISLVESNGATLGKIDAVNAGFNLQGDLKASLVSGDTSVDLTKMTAVLKADGNKSTIEVTAGLTTTKSNADLTKVIGSTDANLKDTLVLEGAQFGATNSGDYTALAQIKDIDLVKVTNSNVFTSGAGILNSATTDGFELEGTLKVNVQAGDAAIDLSKITATKNGQYIDINAADAKGDVITIVGSNSANIADRLQASGDFSRLESIDQVNEVHLGSGGTITANALKTITNAVDVTISGSANALTSIQATSAVDVKALSNGHNALTSIAGKTVDLGSGDFTALTSLTGTVKGDGTTAAKLSYDKLADQITTTGLVLDGSTTNKLEISDATTAGVSTDLSKVTSVGGTSGEITITNVDENITLSAKDQNIKETVTLSQNVTISATTGTKSGLELTNVGSGDVIDLVNVKDKIGISTLSSTVTKVSGGETISGDKVSFYNLTDTQQAMSGLDNNVTAASVLNNGTAVKVAASANAIIALNNASTNKSYIYAINNGTGTTIEAGELKLIAVVDTLVTTGASGDGTTITFA